MRNQLPGPRAPPDALQDERSSWVSGPKPSTIVDCPYCDGENVLPSGPGNHTEGKDHEIACAHCQCFFLLSESKQAVNYPPQPDA